MSFKGPLPECTSYQFLKIIIFYCTVNAMMICVVVDMRNWCYWVFIDVYLTITSKPIQYDTVWQIIFIDTNGQSFKNRTCQHNLFSTFLDGTIPYRWNNIPCTIHSSIKISELFLIYMKKSLNLVNINHNALYLLESVQYDTVWQIIFIDTNGQSFKNRTCQHNLFSTFLDGTIPW
jgi:hypothetical protein